MTGVTVSAIATIVGLGVGLYFTQAVLRHWIKGEKVDARAVAICEVGWTVALGSYVVTDQAFLLIGQLTHIPNLAWLLGYWVLVVNLHYITVIMALTLKFGPARIERSGWSTVAVIALLTIIFFAGGIAFSSVNLVRTLPRTIGEMIYVDVTQAYVAYVFVEPLLMSLRMLRNEASSWEARFRSATLVLVFSSGILFSILQIGITISTYYTLITNREFIVAVETISVVLFAISILLWPVAFVPSKWVKVSIQARQLQDVRYLYRKLGTACSEGNLTLVDIPASLWARLAKCRFYMDMIQVFVMDMKWLLREGSLTIQDGKVLAAVNSLDETLPADQLLTQFAALSRQLNRLDRPESEDVHA